GVDVLEVVEEIPQEAGALGQVAGRLVEEGKKPSSRGTRRNRTGTLPCRRGQPSIVATALVRAGISLHWVSHGRGLERARDHFGGGRRHPPGGRPVVARPAVTGAAHPGRSRP